MKNVEQALIDSNENQTETVASLSVAAVIPKGISSDGLSGTYVSDIKSPTPWFFKNRGQRTFKIIFQQDGNEITGINEPYKMKVSGTREGNDITFYTAPSKIIGEMRGQWKISADGSKLVGKWNRSGQSGQWNLEKID